MNYSVQKTDFVIMAQPDTNERNRMCDSKPLQRIFVTECAKEYVLKMPNTKNHVYTNEGASLNSL
jgi:hypothetical protein